MNAEPSNDDEVRHIFGETHALIYTDGYVALTLYECCYAIWSLHDGKCIAGRFVSPKTHRLSEESVKKIWKSR